MISKESQSAVDNMTAGYITMFTDLEAEVTEPGNVWVNKKFAGTHNVNIATARHESTMVILITDDDDPSMVVEEVYGDLGEVTDRIKQMGELSDEEVSND